MPPKLRPVILRLNDFRYFLLEGGRGGGKSQTIGRFLLYLGDRYKLRIVCGREIQNSISESVYSLLSDLIQLYGLNYEIFSTKITHRETGTTIHFRGFREQGKFNIQGMEGVDILWIDESQAITKETLDILIPTIRKDHAKIFFSMNRYLRDDPVYVKFCGRNDCLHISINYFENPHCTQALKKEAEECKKTSEKDYNHIWLGYPLDQPDDALFAVLELEGSKHIIYPLRQGYGRKIAGFDIARYGGDKCACVVLRQQGALHWETTYVEQWEKKDLNFTTGKILYISAEQETELNIIDEDGIGAGPLDNLNKGRGLEHFRGFRNRQYSYQNNSYYVNPRTMYAYKVKDMITQGHLRITDDALISELLTLRYTFDSNQRKILISKEKMRRKGISSPNLADALIMAVSLIDAPASKQEEEFAGFPKQYIEEDILKAAGIR